MEGFLSYFHPFQCFFFFICMNKIKMDTLILWGLNFTMFYHMVWNNLEWIQRISKYSKKKKINLLNNVYIIYLFLIDLKCLENNISMNNYNSHFYIFIFSLKFYFSYVFLSTKIIMKFKSIIITLNIHLKNHPK